MNYDSLKLIINEAVVLKNKHKDWRLGQSYFNALARIDPALANKIRGSKNDPYYDDTILHDFITALVEEGEKSVHRSHKPPN